MRLDEMRCMIEPMERRHLESAERARWSIEHEAHDPSTFRAALLDVPSLAREDWVDLVLGLDDLHEDGPDLPRGCVPYLPCSVDTVMKMIDWAAVCSSDVFVDVGAGAGRTTALVHLLTGAAAIGIEIQHALVVVANELTARLALSRVRCIEGDATSLTGHMTTGSVFFFNCPFSGQRLARVLDDLEALAQTRVLRFGCVNLQMPPRAWLAMDTRAGELAIYRSTLQPLRPAAPLP